MREPDGAVRMVTSRFVEQMLERDERQRARDGWKQKSAGWQATSQEMFLAAQLGMDQGTGRRIAFTSVPRIASRAGACSRSTPTPLAAYSS